MNNTSASALGLDAITQLTDNQGDNDTLSLDKALITTYFDTTGGIMDRMQDHHSELEDHKNKISFLNKISARIATMTDEMGTLKTTSKDDVAELQAWLEEAKADMKADVGDIQEFIKAPNPVSTQNLAGNIRTAIEEYKHHCELGLSRSQALQQQFNLIVTMINEVIKKHDQCKKSPVQNIRS